MTHTDNAARFVVIASIVLTMILGLLNFGSAAAWGESGNPVISRASIKPGNPCSMKQPAQVPASQSLTSLASNTFCDLYLTVAATDRTLFAGNPGIQYLPWAPILVGMVLVCFLILGGWCSWKMRGYRPRRKYNIGRVI